MENIKKLKEFADLVKQMRASQKRYFNYKKGSDLYAEKQLEYKVDSMIEIILENKPKDLFHNEN